MVSTLCLLTCALTIGQASDWQLQPQLARGQELVYTGSFSEVTLSPGVQFQHAFQIETKVFVLEASAQKFDLAFLTAVTAKPTKTAVEPGKNGPTPSSVRLEVVSMDRRGKLQPQATNSIAPPLDGPPTVECGAFVEVPKGRVSENSWWEVNDEGRTPRTWRVDGTEIVSNVLCVRLVGSQHSQDWDAPRADRAAWNRSDTVWISPQFGLTYRFERIFERRNAARQEPSQRSVLRCELESNLTYPPGRIFDERKGEIEQARKYWQQVDALVREPEQNKAMLEAILKRIKQYSNAQPPTPYRKAIVQVQKRVEAALRGDTTPEQQAEDSQVATPKFAIGQRISDFVCTDLVTHDTQRLQRVLGKPVVVMFFNPSTENGQRVLQFGQTLSQSFPQTVSILAMAVTEDPELVQKQHKEMRLAFSILDGSGLVPLFGVEALPRVVVLDSQGIVRAAYTGWGFQTPNEITTQLKKLVPR